jgi:hypothetical protein
MLLYDEENITFILLPQNFSPMLDYSLGRGRQGFEMQRPVRSLGESSRVFLGNLWKCLWENMA